jgi:hypothetical protein
LCVHACVSHVLIAYGFQLGCNDAWGRGAWSEVISLISEIRAFFPSFLSFLSFLPSFPAATQSSASFSPQLPSRTIVNASIQQAPLMLLVLLPLKPGRTRGVHQNTITPHITLPFLTFLTTPHTPPVLMPRLPVLHR